MQAQTTTVSPTGEYYLTGVMETASGFKLNADHSFEFFFSYGALDREGSGTWKQEGETIVFNSLNKDRKDYSLLQSKKERGDKLTIRITGANEHLRKMMHAIVRTGDKVSEAVAADAAGFIYFPVSSTDSITLLFEWCPEKTFIYKVPDTTHNYFEFRFEPSIMDVIFDNFTLLFTKDGFEGAHPMDTTKKFSYKKAVKEQE